MQSLRVAVAVSVTMALAVVDLVAQNPQGRGPYRVGVREIAFSNPYAGSASIPCFVSYPGKAPLKGADLDRRGAPYPVIVFGHGYGALGTNYRNLAEHFASWGFVFVAPNTFQHGPIASQSLDMQALTRILRDEGSRRSSFFAAAVDINHLGVSGHSMGAGAAAGVLGSSADVQAGVLLAPWDGGKGQPDASDAMRTARAPFQILVGAGDTLTPASTHSIKFYQKASHVRDYRGMLTLWSGCGHGAVAGFINPSNVDDVEAYRLCRLQMTAFLLAYLQERDDMLDVAVGELAHAEPRFDRLEYTVADPNLYITGAPGVGGSLDYHVMARADTPVLLYAATTPGEWRIPGLGVLGLDPSEMVFVASMPTSQRQTLHVVAPIPNQYSLAGLKIWIQAAAANQHNTYRLTPTRSFAIER